MNRKASALLIGAMITGLVAGTTAFANEGADAAGTEQSADKKGEKAAKAKKKKANKAKAGKAATENACGGENGCKGEGKCGAEKAQ